ncbi:MarR family transcriptional regulator [Cohnella sp. CFH 77786]|uniref:MarR family winged helix-turn-helix transcriptional regulator n=1 Tax=Cohnella sp. CFH 77786 TaxID=2662265 RepID=UPI001C60BB88|nr:MarR family transcriptional regulator [Cohnella sp. CFH 77786]MBW5447999.1 MarR family transcriptional regulator [Cohnella sp. CFH 77786]
MDSEFKEAKQSPGFLLWQVTNLWQREIRRALDPLELTHPQFVLLFSTKWLNERGGDGGVTQVQLAQHAKMDVNVTSQVLRTLEKKGYIKRSPHPRDTRANVITTTPAGSELASRAVQAVEAADRSFFSGIGEGKREFMGVLLQLSQRP